MKVVVAEKILEMMGLEKTSENYQKVYKVGDMILKNADDYFVYETAITRNLASPVKCEICGKDKERFYSDNGVFDSERCLKEDITGKHS